MIEVKWTSKAVSDIARLNDFLSPVDRRAAARTVQALTAAPARLLEQPRLGERLEEFGPREIRRILVGRMTYAMKSSSRRSMYCGFGIRVRIGRSRYSRLVDSPRTNLGVRMKSCGGSAADSGLAILASRRCAANWPSF